MTPLLLAAALAMGGQGRVEACPPPLTTADSFLTVMADPEAAAIVSRHAPVYVRLLDHQVSPPPSPELTLNDMLEMPALGVSEADLKAINAALAALAEARCSANRRS